MKRSFLIDFMYGISAMAVVIIICCITSAAVLEFHEFTVEEKLDKVTVLENKGRSYDSSYVFYYIEYNGRKQNLVSGIEGLKSGDTLDAVIRDGKPYHALDVTKRGRMRNAFERFMDVIYDTMELVFIAAAALIFILVVRYLTRKNREEIRDDYRSLRKKCYITYGLSLAVFEFIMYYSAYIEKGDGWASLGDFILGMMVGMLVTFIWLVIWLVCAIKKSRQRRKEING